MTDVLLYQTVDGGDVEIEDGRLSADDDIATAMYLSLFGGNEDDSGRDGDDLAQWWGNFAEPDSRARLRSETQHILRNGPPTSGIIRTLEIAVARDLDWLIGFGIARRVEVTVTIPARNRVAVVADVITDSGVSRYEFTQGTGAA